MSLPTEYLTNPVFRGRLMDLSFSLYESMGDFLNDMVILDAGDTDDVFPDDMYERLNTACMNCLGDIELLTPIMLSIRKHLNSHMH